MSESVFAHLRRLIDAGDTPDKATETVMADLPRRWKDFARPFVLRAARGIEGEIVNRRMRAALGPVHGPQGERHRKAAADRLHQTVYRLPNGQRVLWDNMTIDMLDLKIAQLRKHVGGLVDHLRIVEAARELCSERGVTRLGDIDNWAELIQKMLDDGPGDD